MKSTLKPIHGIYTGMAVSFAHVLWSQSMSGVMVFGVMAAIWTVWNYFQTKAEERLLQAMKTDEKTHAEIQKLTDRIGKIELKLAFNKPKEK